MDLCRYIVLMMTKFVKTSLAIREWCGSLVSASFKILELKMSNELGFPWLLWLNSFIEIKY